MNTIQRIHPETVFAFPGIHGGVRAGNLLFVSGQVPLGPSGELVGVGDFRAQAEQVFINLGEVLAAGGSGFERIVKLTAFFVDIARDLPAYREVRDQFIDAEHACASSAVQVSRLFHPSVWLEVEAIAVCEG
ncbi:RidA family protein [Dyella acidisoli]|uniref:Enamine deaminase RidA n=1 Tax=Dyella acidisoli TaxID=1867834 RepID=A0ABQ5XQZ0_9GAMM|nr:RidA family protein [Dyella acidisoli]GLQ93807.1 enamine deaminase RidA [Dyella acidisoli]